MNNLQDLVKTYQKQVDEIAKSNLNQDQKELIKEILSIISQKENVSEYLIQQLFQLLIQRIKIGFTFDVAPTTKVDTIAYLQKDKKLSFNIDKEKNTHSLIIGENYDALKNLIFIEAERERERERE
ncbi:type III restriction endonuclease subunit M [Mycoplasma sp. 1578d]|uniref:type III restriction endonuclease subunit M n=1 Tax=Mycoplasma sp. 1578d TaxID=2967299 RepID=UPI00211D1258|nr:type III restriction endonuclease subunit M [Mycoplasma sp. 1578d]UUM20033.1 type III restriction endonuclease subunit M [Mycoplasma sp. 1578d]